MLLVLEFFVGLVCVCVARINHRMKENTAERWRRVKEGEVFHIATHGMPIALGVYNMFYGEPEGPVNC